MRQIFILITLTVLISCKTQVEDASEEVLVIQQTFEKAVYAMSKNDWEYARPFIRKFPPLGESSNTSKKIYTEKPTKHFYIVNDTLFNTKHFLLFSKTLKTDNKILLHPDSIEQILKQGKLKSLTAKLVIDTSAYATKTDSSFAKNKNFNGSVSFSRVVFNSKRNIACYYMSQHLNMGGRGWGMGTIVFAKKQKGKWIFVREEEIWIA